MHRLEPFLIWKRSAGSIALRAYQRYEERGAPKAAATLTIGSQRSAGF
jgi:hypothetical protein